MLRFSGFELDSERAELRGPDGESIKLRPKTLEILGLLAGNAGRVLSKQQLMEAVWPNVHVGEDSLFQCIREIRTALGDDKRQVIRVMSGRGYLFQAEVTVEAGRVPAAPKCARQPARARRTDTAATAETAGNPRNGLRLQPASHSPSLLSRGLAVLWTARRRVGAAPRPHLCRGPADHRGDADRRREQRCPRARWRPT